ncbi:MAG: M16 family metallopeptidase [Syntrophomonadaceae bacterium]
MISCWKLNSGARLVIEEIPYVKSAAVGVFVNVGSRHEPATMSGASHFIEHMLFKGTDTRSAREIAEIFETVGGQVNAFTAKEYTCIYARTLDESIYTAIDVIFDMLFNSSFQEKDFDTEKNVVVEEINMYEDTPDDLIHDVFAQKMWLGNSMASPVLGTVESVNSFERQSIVDYYKKAYVPDNMVISVAGNVEATKIRDAVEEYLDKQPPAHVTKNSNSVSRYSPFTNLVNKDTEQVQICIGVPGISYHDENRFTQNVMNSILGGGVSSRLFQTLREELGLAYSVYSYPAIYSDTGCYSIYAGIGPTKIKTFFSHLFKVLNDFCNNGVRTEEVKRAQQLIKSSMYLGLESVMNRMNRLGRSVLMYNRVTSVDDVIERIFQVDVDSVNSFSRDLLRIPAFSLAAIGSDQILDQVEKEFRQWVENMGGRL